MMKRLLFLLLPFYHFLFTGFMTRIGFKMKLKVFMGHIHQSNDLTFRISDFSEVLDLPKLCRYCSFPQKLYTRKLGEITVYITMVVSFYET